MRIASCDTGWIVLGGWYWMEYSGCMVLCAWYRVDGTMQIASCDTGWIVPGGWYWMDSMLVQQHGNVCMVPGGWYQVNWAAARYCRHGTGCMAGPAAAHKLGSAGRREHRQHGMWSTCSTVAPNVSPRPLPPTPQIMQATLGLLEASHMHQTATPLSSTLDALDRRQAVASSSPSAAAHGASLLPCKRAWAVDGAGGEAEGDSRGAGGGRADDMAVDAEGPQEVMPGGAGRERGGREGRERARGGRWGVCRGCKGRVVGRGQRLQGAGGGGRVGWCRGCKGRAVWGGKGWCRGCKELKTRNCCPVRRV